MSKRFKIESKFPPAGDQPTAIKTLVEGLQAGEAGMTLLGVTGSGKSIGYADPLIIVENINGIPIPRLVNAGPYIDELMRSAEAKKNLGGDTHILEAAESREQYTISYDPKTGNTSLYPVQAFIRHIAPEEMYKLRTSCGREVTLTGDHNLWVLRYGELKLIRTDEAKDDDCLPIPEAYSRVGEMEKFEVLDFLKEEPFFVYTGNAVVEYEKAYGISGIAETFKASGLSAYPKIWAIRHDVHGNGIKIPDFLALTRENEAFAQMLDYSHLRVGARGPKMSIPARIPLTPEIMTFLGLYIAEGCQQRNYILISNYHPALRIQVESALNLLGLPFTLRSNSDYQISSTVLSKLLKQLCGRDAFNKRLPFFWISLSDEQLGFLLRGYFDGDGTVERKGEVSAISASKSLISDVTYAMFRFGIWARIRKVRKQATNSSHKGGVYYQVVISGQENLARFNEKVGFEHPEKLSALKRCLGRVGNTNVDKLPVNGITLRKLRCGLDMSMNTLAKLAGCSRATVSYIESHKRQPSRELLKKILLVLKSESSERKVYDSIWSREWRKVYDLTRVHWTPVADVTRVEYSHPYVYDLSVPGPETFLAGYGGIFVHNTFTIANVIEQVQRPTLIMAHNKTLAAQLYGEMKEFFPHNSVEYFVSYYDYYQPEAYVAASDTFIEKDASINEHIEQMRLSATKAMLERQDTIIVATVSAIYGLGDPNLYLKMMLHLVRGETVDQRFILRRLSELQYTRNDLDFRRATYRVRGEVIDIFPAESEKEAVRIELFDDEIEQLSYFDPLTGEVLRRVARLTIYPKTHYVTPRQTILDAIDSIKEELKERLEQLRSQDKLVEAQRLEQRTRYDIEMMLELGYCSGIENYSRYLSGRAPGQPPPTLFDYLPDDSLLVIDESHVTVSQIGAMYKGDRSRKENLVTYGFRLPSALDNRPMKFEEFEQISPQTIYVSATPAKYELAHSGEVVEQVVRPTGLIDPEVEIRPATTQVDDLLSEIHKRTDVGERILVTTLTKRMSEDLTDYLSEHGVRVRYMHSDIDTVERMEIIRDLRLGEFDVLVGINLLREGLDMPEVSLVAILDADKEGFLRSETSLIQTIGRAARHLNGHAILYADRITGSMQRAIDETDRRRAKQVAYNKAHGITPRGVKKAIHDILESGYPGVPGKAKEYAKVAEELIEYSAMSPKALQKTLKGLEEKMYQHAKNLEFEEAARVRDEISRIQDKNLGLGEPASD